MKEIQKIVQNNLFLCCFVVLIVTASVFRFYQLGVIPHGMTWDEAAIGYNGFSVLTTRRDEWLRLLPISFQSFGDYKAPVAIYINGFFTLVFGLNLFAIRLPFALSSIVAITSFAWLCWLLAKLCSVKKPVILSLLVTTFFVFSPWHIHFSRAGFESGMSLSFIVLGIALLLTFIFKQKEGLVLKKIPVFLQNNLLLLFVSSGFLVASMYTYHSAKIVAPLLGLLVILFFINFWKKQLGHVFFVALCSLVMLLPMAWDSLYGPGATRLTQTSIFSTQGSNLEKAIQLTTNFSSHFSPNFLIFGETSNLRHGAGEWGVLFPTTLSFALLAIVFLVTKKHQPNRTKTVLFFIGWIIIGIIPASLGADEVPHSNRALLALPGFLGLATVGLLELIEAIQNSTLNQKLRGNHGEKNTVRDAAIGMIILLHAIFFLSFWRYYTTVFVANSSEDYQDGYLEAFEIAVQYEKGINGKPEVDKIVFSDEYGQPYIYALVARKTSPEYYRGGSLIKYEFKNVDIGDFQRTNTLVVGSAEDTDLPIERADHVVYGGSNEVRFQLYYLP